MYKYLRYLLVFLLTIIVPNIGYSQGKKALLVGISDYESFKFKTGWMNVNGTNDVELIKNDLKVQGFNDVQLLTDAQATYGNIIKGLDRLISKAEKGDIIYFHFSGHGQPILDQNDDEGLEDRWDESIIPIDAALCYSKDVYEGEHHITDDLLSEKLLKLRKKVGKNGFVYAILDACYSGTGTRDGDLNSDSDETAPTRGIDLGFDFGEGIFYDAPITRQTNYVLTSSHDLSDIMVLEACLPHQTNREIKVDDNYYGPLSYYIHQTLQFEKIDNRGGWIKHVISLFKSDRRTFNQNIVCESSLNNGKGN